MKDSCNIGISPALPFDEEHHREATPGFIAYAHTHIEKMRLEGKYDAANKLRKYVARFIAYLGKNDIPFKDFDSLLIRNYHTWLENRKLGRNSISLYIRNLKRIYQLAVRDGLATEQHPFEGMDVSYWVKKERNGLTLDEVKRLRNADLSGYSPKVAFARDMFLFSVYTHGMTGDDIFHLTKDNIQGGILTYRKRTTGKEISMPWEPVMQEILDRHTRPDTPYLFPVLTAEQPYEQWKQHCSALHNINRNLKTVARLLEFPFPLNMTVAHHSWESMTKSVSINDLL